MGDRVEKRPHPKQEHENVDDVGVEEAVGAGVAGGREGGPRARDDAVTTLELARIPYDFTRTRGPSTERGRLLRLALLARAGRVEEIVELLREGGLVHGVHVGEQQALGSMAAQALQSGMGISGLEQSLMGLGLNAEQARAAVALGAGNLAVAPYTTKANIEQQQREQNAGFFGGITSMLAPGFGKDGVFS